MALAIRFVPVAGRTVITCNGRPYPVSGATIDIPMNDARAVGDQARQLTIIGATADRPPYNPGAVNGGMPMQMYDTTVGGPIFYVPNSDPPQWVNISGASV